MWGRGCLSFPVCPSLFLSGPLCLIALSAKRVASSPISLGVIFFSSSVSISSPLAVFLCSCSQLEGGSGTWAGSSLRRTFSFLLAMTGKTKVRVSLHKGGVGEVVQTGGGILVPLHHSLLQPQGNRESPPPHLPMSSQIASPAARASLPA